MTNAEKVYRSIVLQMSDWDNDFFHSVNTYDENTGLTREQWYDGIQTNIKKGRFSRQEINLCDNGKTAWLVKRIYRLIRTERYIKIAENCWNLESGDIAIGKTEEMYLRKVNVLHSTDESWYAKYLKVISETEYQNQIVAEKLNEKLPSYVTKVEPDNSDTKLSLDYKKSYQSAFQKTDKEPKAGNYVRIKDSPDVLFYRNEIVKVYKLPSELSKYFYVNDETTLPNSFIKKVIELPNRFKINAGKHSEIIQEILIELGYRWKGGTEKTSIYQKLDLLIISNEKLIYCSTKGYFESNLSPELTVSEFYEHVGLEMPAITKSGELAGASIYEEGYCDNCKYAKMIFDANRYNKKPKCSVGTLILANVFPCEDEYTANKPLEFCDKRYIEQTDMESPITKTNEIVYDKALTNEQIIEGMYPSDDEQLKAKNKPVKPQLGLMPKKLWLEKRLQVIQLMLEKKVKHNEMLQIEWINEYNELIKQIGC